MLEMAMRMFRWYRVKRCKMSSLQPSSACPRSCCSQLVKFSTDSRAARESSQKDSMRRFAQVATGILPNTPWCSYAELASIDKIVTHDVGSWDCKRIRPRGRELASIPKDPVKRRRAWNLACLSRSWRNDRKPQNLEWCI